MMKHRKKAEVFYRVYPYFFALFPILSVYAANSDEVPVTDLILPIAVCLAGVALCLFVLKLVMRSYKRASIATSVFTLAFFLHGELRKILPSPEGMGERVREPMVIAVLILICVGGIFLTLMSDRKVNLTVRLFGIVGTVLLIGSLVQVGMFAKDIPERPNPINFELRADELPDIYFIILDEYARNDTLEEYWGYDNSRFTDHLEDKGFYVAYKARSNFTWTVYSLPTTLWMRYLTEDEGREDPYDMTWIVR